MNTTIHNTPLVHRFVSPESAGRRYALGRNAHAKNLSNAIQLDGFIDDFAETGTHWQNKPVVKMPDVPSDAIIINCVMAISPVTAVRNLTRCGLNRVLAYSDLCRTFPDRFPIPQFVEQTRHDYAQNKHKWDALSSNLADGKSETVLNDVLQYRLSGDLASMQSYAVRIKDQYFEPFLQLGNDEVFVDCGGFDGDTTEEFCKRYPQYEKIYLFEPLPENMRAAQWRLRDKTSLHFVQQGVSDKTELLTLQASGSASSISDHGTQQIEVTTIDEYISDRVTFIKMDLEGWESRAIQGCKHHILQDHPKLAIAVYHHPADFWRLPESVLNLRHDYDIYIRHYTEGWSETVMFFVPQ